MSNRRISPLSSSIRSHLVSADTSWYLLREDFLALERFQCCDILLALPCEIKPDDKNGSLGGVPQSPSHTDGAAEDMLISGDSDLVVELSVEIEIVLQQRELVARQLQPDPICLQAGVDARCGFTKPRQQDVLGWHHREHAPRLSAPNVFIEKHVRRTETA